MARHNQRNGFRPSACPTRAPHRASRSEPQPHRKRASCLWNRARGLVHAAMKRRQTIHIEDNIQRSVLSPLRSATARRSPAARPAGGGASLASANCLRTRARVSCFVRFRKLDRDDAARTHVMAHRPIVVSKIAKPQGRHRAIVTQLRRLQ